MNKRSQIPLENFFRRPARSGFQISPCGTYLAFLAPWEGRANLHVQRIGEPDARRITGAKSRDIQGYAWGSAARIVYLEDTGGDENYKLHAVDIDGSRPLLLTPFEGVQAALLDELEDADDHALITLNRRDPAVFDVYRANIMTGELALVAENPGDISAWLADHRGELRVAVVTSGMTTRLLYRDAEADDFRVIGEASSGEALTPLLFTFDDQDLYVTTDKGRDRQAIVVYDTRAGQEREVVYEHPEVDITEIVYSARRRRLSGVRYTTDRLRFAFFDDERRRLQEELERRLPGRVVSPVIMSRDETRMVISAFADRQPEQAYLYDARTGALELLSSSNEDLRLEDLAEVRPIHYKNPLGMTIHGYVTLPAGPEPPLPLVVFPHGGPWARDAWGFDQVAQFLASRGYAVLQVNFRGSTGYGKAFCRAGFKEWGRGIQDDITFGVRHLIDAGTADPARVAIYGESFGGFAALCGLAFTPELYACGVSVAGISDILAWLEEFPPYWTPFLSMMHEMVGHPEEDRAALELGSPYLRQAAIRAPLLVVHGANDPRVKRGQSDRLVEAMARRGADVRYVLWDDEGHSFEGEESSLELFRELERFFGDHLGSEVSPAPAPDEP